jgi:hypothetical protein
VTVPTIYIYLEGGFVVPGGMKKVPAGTGVPAKAPQTAVFGKVAGHGAAGQTVMLDFFAA